MLSVVFVCSLPDNVLHHGDEVLDKLVFDFDVTTLVDTRVLPDYLLQLFVRHLRLLGCIVIARQRFHQLRGHIFVGNQFDVFILAHDLCWNHGCCSCLDIRLVVLLHGVDLLDVLHGKFC